MKASLTFRDEHSPLAMAKVPISILTLPFTAAATTSTLPSDLRIDLSTAFPAFPSLRLSYRPNSPSSPFSLRLKSGLGVLGSPAHAPFSMSAEFLLPSHPHSSPTFTVLLKPRLGDFHVKRIITSPPILSINHKTETDPPVIEFPSLNSTSWKGGNYNTAAKMFSGVEISARSELPLWSGANVRFRWGVKMPQDGKKMPVMVMSKVSIEHVAVEEFKKGKKAGDEMVEMCMAVTQQLEGMKAENGMLRKAVEELRMDVGGGRWKEMPVPRNGNGDVRNGGGVVKKGDVKVPEFVGKGKPEEEELKKALMGKIGAGK